MRAWSMAVKYSFAQRACIRSPEPAQVMNAGVALRGIGGPASRAKGVGPGKTRVRSNCVSPRSGRAPAPHERDAAVVEVPLVPGGGGAHEHVTLGIADNLG